MYKQASCTCKVGVLLIKSIVFWRSRCRPRPWILKSLISSQNINTNYLFIAREGEGNETTTTVNNSNITTVQERGRSWGEGGSRKRFWCQRNHKHDTLYAKINEYDDIICVHHGWFSLRYQAPNLFSRKGTSPHRHLVITATVFRPGRTAIHFHIKNKPSLMRSPVNTANGHILKS